MSESLFPTFRKIGKVSFRKIGQTPMRDLLRGRVTGRLNWKATIASAALPVEVAMLILRVVKNTRLYALERAAVAQELIAHFRDGIDSGVKADELISKFGEERLASKLIRRAKKRGRSIFFRAWLHSLQAIIFLCCLYTLLLIRFCIGRPNPSTDYFAKLNDPVVSVPAVDRAWPMWEKAILTASDGFKDGAPVFSNAILWGQDAPPWSQTASWIDQHQRSISLARRAGQLPSLGYVYGPGGSQDDRALFPNGFQQDKDQPLISVLLPHLSYLRHPAIILSQDSRRAVELNDGGRAAEDLMSMLGLARQLHGSHGFVVADLVAIGIDAMALDRIQRILERHANVLNDSQLIQFAHLFAGPEVAADLVSLDDERKFFYDIVQRIYTDDGHGDGRITLKGMKMLPMFVAVGGSENPAGEDLMVAASPVPMLIASRAEMTGLYDQFMDQTEANFQKPLRQINWETFDSRLISMHTSPIQNMRYILLTTLLPSLHNAQASCERYLGERDGTLVAISLEIYHRRHGVYPATLSDLVPELLPQIPVDRITGDPVKYRLIEGKPVVYSVGADRVDDGGNRSVPVNTRHSASPIDAARWDVSPANAVRGDWVLYPPEPSGDD